MKKWLKQAEMFVVWLLIWLKSEPIQVFKPGTTIWIYQWFPDRQMPGMAFALASTGDSPGKAWNRIVYLEMRDMDGINSDTRSNPVRLDVLEDGRIQTLL